MIKLTFIAATAILVAGSAQAQDASWTGPYVGAHINLTQGASDATVDLTGSWSIESSPFRTSVAHYWGAELEPEGVGGGVFAGYRRQFSNDLVIGAELSYSHVGADASRVTPQVRIDPLFTNPTYSFENAVELQQAVSISVQAGYSFGDFLGYATVGYTLVDATASAGILGSNGFSKAGEGSDWTPGYSVGFGGAYRVSERVSVHAEFTHTELDAVEFSTAYRPGSTFAPPAFDYTDTFAVDAAYDTMRIGVSYAF